ncbi:DUF1826 domain-containing protein [Shimia sp. MIT910701]|uniref:DUF1826 domain-containing protein n=1 Tax=Shimia sp. MIT910701 TaxID=3096987 RepID=UPI00399B8F66
MIQLLDIETDTIVGVGFSDRVEGLSAIKDAGCAAVVWERDAPNFAAWLAVLPPSQLPKTRVVVTPAQIAAEAELACQQAGTPDCGERDALIADIAHLAETFAATANAPYLRLRLDVVTTNACRKFHIDAVKSRLVCTYRGTGTQYGNSPDRSDPAFFGTVQTGNPIVLRGTLWPETPSAGLLHRSPPIEGTGETRLLLVLDPIFDVEDAY